MYLLLNNKIEVLSIHISNYSFAWLEFWHVHIFAVFWDA